MNSLTTLLPTAASASAAITAILSAIQTTTEITRSLLHLTLTTATIAATPLRFARQLTAPVVSLAWDIILFLWSPAIEVTKYFITWGPPLLSFIRALKPLYTFFGVAALIGIITGTLAFALSSLFSFLLTPSPPPPFPRRRLIHRTPRKPPTKTNPLLSPSPSTSYSTTTSRLLSPPASPQLPATRKPLARRTQSGTAFTQAKDKGRIAAEQRVRLQRLRDMRRQVAFAEQRGIKKERGIPETIVQDGEMDIAP